MGKVIPLGCITKLDLEPDHVLEATKGKLEGLIIIGYHQDGSEYFASTYSDGAEVLWLLERCKKMLLGMPDGLE